MRAEKEDVTISALVILVLKLNLDDTCSQRTLSVLKLQCKTASVTLVK